MGNKRSRDVRRSREASEDSQSSGRSQAPTDIVQERAGRSRRKLEESAGEERASGSVEESAGEESSQSSTAEWLASETPSRESSVGRGLDKAIQQIESDAYWKRKWLELREEKKEHKRQLVGLEQNYRQELDALQRELKKLAPELPKRRRKAVEGSVTMLGNIAGKASDEIMDEYLTSEALEKYTAAKMEHSDPSSATSLDRQDMLKNLEEAAARGSLGKDLVLSEAREYMRTNRKIIDQQIRELREGLQQAFQEAEQKLTENADKYKKAYQRQIRRVQTEIERLSEE